MPTKRMYHPVIEELITLIKAHHWIPYFSTAIKNAYDKQVPLLENVASLEDYLDWLNEFLYWIPQEDASGGCVNDHLSASYFIADQEPLLSLQNKIMAHDNAPAPTPFSKWLVDYATALGAFHDTPESLTEASEKHFMIHHLTTCRSIQNRMVDGKHSTNCLQDISNRAIVLL